MFRFIELMFLISGGSDDETGKFENLSHAEAEGKPAAKTKQKKRNLSAQGIGKDDVPPAKRPLSSPSSLSKGNNN